MQPSTIREAPGGAPVRLRLLTYVLGYDDLLAARTTTFALDHVESTLEIGRGADEGPPRLEGGASLRLADRWLSRRHAVIERAADERADVLRDAGSANGTYVNGVRLAAPHPLADGDLIAVGHSLLCYRLADASHAAELRRPDDERRLGPTPTFCPAVAALASTLRRIAPTTERVLVLGETGAGKELVAAMLHALSGRRGEYRAVDCGAVPESLFEGTFFGHRRGAFTGAVEARVGEIQRADGGTLFLDEVANLSVASQAKLLRVIEDGRFTPLGAPEALRADVRWISAANRDLFAEPAAFRPDLLRRLAGFVATLPPLRERREDLGVLTAFLLRDAGVARASITAEAGRRLFADVFAGNVRQLRATLRAAAVLAAGGPIELRHLQLRDEARGAAGPVVARTPRPVDSGGASTLVPPPPVAPAPAPTRAEIETALGAARGNVSQAARALGTYPKQLYRWIARFEIDVDTFRQR